MSSGEGYMIEKLLGSGQFGEVFLAKKGRKRFAIKKVVNTETAQQEIKILEREKQERKIHRAEYLEMHCLFVQCTFLPPLQGGAAP